MITDWYEGSNKAEMLRRAAQLVASGVQVISLPALDDKGAPVFDHRNAVAFAVLGGGPGYRVDAGRSLTA